MIYEIRTYNLKPNSNAEVEKRFAEAYERRKSYSELSAIWRTEGGPHNQIVHVWGYEDFTQRMAIRSAAVRDGAWPPKLAEFTEDMVSEIMLPLPFSPALKVGNLGPYFEMCIDTMANSAEFRKSQPLLEQALVERTKLSPLYALWYSEIGNLNQFVHIWSYRSLDERSRVLDTIKKNGGWLPSQGYVTLRQESRLLVPLSFSPVQ